MKTKLQKNMYKFLAIITLSIFTSSCTNLISLQQEQQMGLSSFQQYKSKNKISYNSRYNSMLKRVGNRIKSVVSYPNAKWEFVVFENSTPNAFALPGGKVGVHTGIFKIAQNDAQLAAVIGHEVAHITKRHGGQTVSKQLSIGLATAALGGIAKQKGISDSIIKAGAVGANLGFIKPFSRNNELEADKIGTFYMAKAGYDPRQAITLWQRFASYKSKNGKKIPEFLSTHPLDQNRISKLEMIMPEALAIYKGDKSYTPTQIKTNYMPTNQRLPRYNTRKNYSPTKVYKARRF